MSEKKQEKIKDIWIITREYDGLAGAGGVKDVCRQLAEALAKKAKVSVILPMYGFIDPQSSGFKEHYSFQVDMNYVGVERREDVLIWERKERKDKKNLTIYLVDAGRYSEKRAVYTYTAEDETENPLHVSGSGHYDYFAMNVLLQKSALNFMLYSGKRPDIIHCQDGHAALLPVMAREIDGIRHFFRKTGMVVTIHNAGLGYHQEVDDLPFAKAITRLPSATIGKNQLNGCFDPFLASAPYAIMNTVSENYARELRETADDELTGWLGHTLAGRGVTLQGVTNGINPEDFNPEKADILGIAAPFSPISGDLEGKKVCRQELTSLIRAKQLGHIRINGTLDDRPDLPLFTLIGRLTAQKGVDKLVDALKSLLPTDDGFQVVILGSGAKEIEKELITLTEIKENQGRITILLGYDEKLANKLYAAGDFFLIPSQYEPCGLTDYIAQLFGNIPIVHHVGGLVKVEDNKTGFVYKEHSAAALMETMQNVLELFRTDADHLRTIQKESIETIYNSYTWDKIMLRYMKLYQESFKLCREP